MDKVIQDYQDTMRWRSKINNEELFTQVIDALKRNQETYTLLKSLFGPTHNDDLGGLFTHTNATMGFDENPAAGGGGGTTTTAARRRRRQELSRLEQDAHTAAANAAATAASQHYGQTDRRWWTSVNGVDQGPYTTEDLKSWLRGGRISDSLLVKPVGSTIYLQLRFYPQLTN